MKFFKNVTRLVAGTSSGVASAVLFSSLFLASGADAAPVPMSPHGSSTHSNVYASIQYYGDFFTNMGDFKGHENASGSLTSSVHGYDKSGAAMVYKPDYITDYIAGGISIGYSMGGPRIEIEGQYANIEVDDDGYTVKDQAKYLELTRGDDISGYYINGVQGGTALNVDKNAFSITSENKHVKDGVFNFASTTLGQGTEITANNHLAAKFTNDGIRFVGGFVNFGYDIPVANAPVSPFVTIGLGLAQTKFLGEEVYGLAYQAKAGVAYNVSDNFSIFVAYNYRGSFVKEYKEVTLNTPIKAISAGTAFATDTDVLAITDLSLITGTVGTDATADINIYDTPASISNSTPTSTINLDDANTGAAGIPGLAPNAAVVASTNATVETTFGVHGLMAGVTLKF